MPTQGRKLKGRVSSGKVPKDPPVAAVRDWRFWVSHRGGPFMIHNVEGCDPRARGCYNTYENLVEQGFLPCPRCQGGK